MDVAGRTSSTGPFRAPLDPAGPLGTVGRYLSRRPRLSRCIAVAAVVWVAIYLAWRLIVTRDGADPILFWVFLAAESVSWLTLLGFVFQTWTVTEPVRRPLPLTLPTVDIFVCTYNEPDTVVRPTLIGAQELAARYGPATVHLLDDGRRPEMRALADEYGAVWRTRADNRHAKAGNINAALADTDSDLVLVLDADHVPDPALLDATVGYFTEVDVALVQTPHTFYNGDSVQHLDANSHGPGEGADQQSVFFRVICPGKDAHGAVFWCGSGAVIRRVALEEVGGVATETIAEDFHTTVKMQARGWRTRFHNEPLLWGLAPLDLAGYLLQRDRWGRGTIQMLKTREAPLRAKISWRSRLCHLTALLYYATGPQHLVLTGTLVITLMTGARPLSGTTSGLALFWLPSMLLASVAGTVLARGWSTLRSSLRHELLTIGIFTRAWSTLFTRRALAFKVTPKDGEGVGGIGAVSLIRDLVLVGAVLAVALAGRTFDLVTGGHRFPPIDAPFAWLIVTLGFLEFTMIADTVWFAFRHRQRREAVRWPVYVPGQLDNGTVATVTDLSTDGFAFEAATAIFVGDDVHVTAHLPEQVIELSGTVRTVTTDRFGFARVGVEAVLDGPVRDAVYRHCFVPRRGGDR